MAKIGILQYTEEDYSEAEKTALDWVKRSRHDASAYQLLGRIYQKQGKIPEAQTQLEKALALNPINDIEMKTDLMEIYLLQKKYEIIILDVDPFLGIYQNKTAPTNSALGSDNLNTAKMLDILGEAYLALNNTEKAKESWQRALEVRPSYYIAQQKLDSLIPLPPSPF